MAVFIKDTYSIKKSIIMLLIYLIHDYVLVYNVI